MAKPTTQTPAYCAGVAAYRAGVSRDAGPHEGATGLDYHLRYDWRAGWDDAEIAEAVAQAEYDAVMREVGRAAAPILTWYYPSGERYNFRSGEAPALALANLGRALGARFEAAKAALDAAKRKGG